MVGAHRVGFHSPIPQNCRRVTESPPTETHQPISRRGAFLTLCAILLVAAAVRLIGSAPPGLHTDEASNVWNAWCLLNMGVDEHGIEWPIFYTRSYGDNRSALFLYFMIPFQAVFGLSPYAARLPATFAGLIAIALMYFVGRRLFDSRAIGLVAAGMMALSPWQIYSSRWGHESSLSPMLVLGAVAALLWAGAPLVNNIARGSVMRAFIAGAICGFACYGYAAVRIFLPVFLLLLVAVTWRKWVELLRDSQGRAWFAGIFAGFFVTFAPLVYQHLTDPDISSRGRLTWVWLPDDSTGTRVAKVAERYLPHFDPRWLFLHNGDDPTQAMPNGFGVLHWYALPFLLFGIGVIVWRSRSSSGARIALLGLVVYPAGDLLSGHPGGPNMLRSLPGLPWVELIAAVGFVFALAYLKSRQRSIIASIVVAVACISTAKFLVRLSHDFRTDRARWSVRTMDLAQACEWLKPRLGLYDIVFWTQKDMSFVYAPVMCYLQTPPKQWFGEIIERSESLGDRFHGADIVWTAGKHRFLFTLQYAEPAIQEVTAGGRRARILYIVRPGESTLEEALKPVHEIFGPDGQVVLRMYDIAL